MTAHHDIAIIGGGASGVLAAIHCLRLATTPLRIALFDPDPELLGKGLAYSTERDEHLLNVPTGKMSAFARQPGDFLDYIASLPGFSGIAREALAVDYAPRRHYAGYLQDRLEHARADSPATLDIVPGRITELRRETAGWALEHADLWTTASHVVLAIGNTQRPLPATLPGALPATCVVEAWDYTGMASINADADVCIVGTGLSMADTVLTLEANGHRGSIHLLSRHALLPLAHTIQPVVDEDFDAATLLPLDVRGRLHHLRARIRDAATHGLPWQAVMERLRPHGQALWRSLSETERRRFLRHAVRYWDIHRHRIAPQVDAVLQSARTAGRLHLHRGRLVSLAADQDRVRLNARSTEGGMLSLQVDHVVNATGLELRASVMDHPLLDQMLADGLARSGPLGLGLDVDADGRLLDADGQPHDTLRVIGSLRIGEAWETIAIPELRVQAETIARAWLAD